MSPSSVVDKRTSVKPRNITFVHDTHTFGGLEIVMLELLRHLDTARFRPSVMISSFNDPWNSAPPLFVEKVLAMNVPILQSPYPGNQPVISQLHDIANMTKLFLSTRTNIVHIHTARIQGARKATISARLAGVPIVLRTEHNSPSAFTSPTNKDYTRKIFDMLTSRIITVSENDRWEQIHYFGRPAKKIYCSHNGIDIKKFDHIHDVRNAKIALGFDPDIAIVGAVGRLDEQKGHMYLLEAAAEVLRSHHNLHFLILGDGPLEQQLRLQVDKLGITSNVHFVGYQPDPVPFIKAMDIAVMSSLHEGFSLSMLEFMALGKPTVVTNHPGLMEASIDTVTGLVVERRSGQDLAKGIKYLLNHPEQAKAMGLAARKRVETHFTFERFMDDMMSLYDSGMS